VRIIQCRYSSILQKCLGFLSIQAVFDEDYPLIEGIFLFIAVAVLLANFFANIVYALLDPRVRDERG
jgi:peptide/nickel transport system permease protein